MNALIFAGLTEPVSVPMRHLTGSDGDPVIDAVLIVGALFLAGLIRWWRCYRSGS
jgi:hypothetical protein